MAAELPIPIFTSLNMALPDLQTAAAEGVRYDSMVKEYESRFGHKPTYIARAPGRVNLIGEHIDYVLFGCFPAAIERDILIACGPSQSASGTSTPSSHPPGGVKAENLDPKYKPQHFVPKFNSALGPSAAEEADAASNVHAETSWHLDIDKRELRWESYVKAGYYGVLSRFFSSTTEHPVPVDLLVNGSVPSGSGLSSSAAMVVSSTLAFLAVNNKLEGITKGQLVEMSMENEKRVGVNSGGLDQAASVICTPHSAIFVDFFPRLSAEPIPLPTPRTIPRAVFVCANSLVVSDKVVSAKIHYNLRVVETLVAARILASRLGLSLGPSDRPRIREIFSRWLGSPELESSPEKVKAGLERFLPEIEKLKPSPEGRPEGELGVTMKEMVEWSGLTEAQFHQVYLSWVDVEAEYFQLYKRTLHVITEAIRVLEFREVCLRAQAAEGELPDDTLRALGALMDASHESCSKLCQSSCPEVDQLAELARASGAYGCRITGAGWGGCTVSLVAEDKVDEFIAKVKEGYAPYKNLEGDKLREVIFATKPSSGAFGQS
ncbi:galactokinase gal [Trametes versicolor FP-101664 SS1]|uniref:galactokinase gal n=1 Tax=Trametes versicolor (strain FP-101664) TaxID=717944 RepID=UPI0004621637|nr:galactokinase gal [Trametes versicolor FP-101664 SS1]EIW57193.1 galactokinase gal [Trametes versicolor FP-101664 SS1]